MDTEKKKGEPLGRPEYQGRGDAQPEGAGDEGGLGFIGDQRGTEDEDPPVLDVNTGEGTPIIRARDGDGAEYRGN